MLNNYEVQSLITRIMYCFTTDSWSNKAC